MKNSSGAIDIELWQHNHDAVGSLRFLLEGGDSALSKHVQRDLMSAFTLFGTKVYDKSGELPKELFDSRMIDRISDSKQTAGYRGCDHRRRNAGYLKTARGWLVRPH